MLLLELLLLVRGQLLARREHRLKVLSAIRPAVRRTVHGRIRTLGGGCHLGSRFGVRSACRPALALLLGRRRRLRLLRVVLEECQDIVEVARGGVAAALPLALLLLGLLGLLPLLLLLLLCIGCRRAVELREDVVELLPASARDPKCAMCSMCDANGGSPTGQTSIITRANKPETMMDFQREACHPKPVFDPELKTRLGERIGWSSYFDPDVQPYKGPKGSLGVVDQHRRFAANDASTINDIPANPNAPLVQAPKFTVCREIQYTCHEFEDHTTKQCLPLDNPNDLNPTTEDHVAVVRQDIGQKQKHLDEKLHRLFTNFFSRRRRST